LSKKAVEAKKAAKLNVFNIPKRSPELNVLDYAIWSEVERRMRLQERAMPSKKRETRSEFENRLDRTARNLLAKFINKSLCDMKRRCQRMHDAKGMLFEEGGRAPKPR